MTENYEGMNAREERDARWKDLLDSVALIFLMVILITAVALFGAATLT